MAEQVHNTSTTTSDQQVPDQETDKRATRQMNGRERSLRIMFGLLLALAIVGATWFIGDRQGWTTIGQGGVNAKLLPRVGEPAPELFTMSTDGEPVLLSQLKGQAVWINFWGSWCPPCRAEMPDVQHAYETLSADGVQVLSISMQESPQDALAYRDSVGATFPVYVDPTLIAGMIDETEQPEVAQQLALMTRDWQIANFPTHIFIDRDGIVRNIILSQMSYDEAVSHGEDLLSSAWILPPAIAPRVA
ncbi:MAG TPA: TlpA disulfide reductase family protein [Thermomicrobiales bacterium]|nr:TlpA disulfide reductase family protein [Thermomicrobiales bacterium]